MQKIRVIIYLMALFIKIKDLAVPLKNFKK